MPDSILREEGSTRARSRNPLEALCAASFAPPDILVSDVALKLIAGIHLATRIREDFPACHVLLFSKGVETNSLLARDSSAGNEISLVPAPVHLLALMERIQSLIQDVHSPADAALDSHRFHLLIETTVRVIRV